MKKGIFYEFFDALSLSGAVMAMFFFFTMVGIVMMCSSTEKIAIHGKEVFGWSGTALTTFVSGKKLGEYEANHQNAENNKTQKENQ